MSDKESIFLDDLLSLMQKHGMVLSSCGCCGGISISRASNIVRQDEYYHGIYNDDHGYDDSLKIRWKEQSK